MNITSRFRHFAFPNYSSHVIGISILIFIIHFTADRIDLWLLKFNPTFCKSISLIDIVDPTSFLKSILFLIALTLLLIPVFKSLNNVWQETKHHNFVRDFLVASGITFGLGILIFQGSVVSNGIVYSQRALSPFTQPSDLYSTRLLMPAVAYLLFFRGYALYFVFSFIITVIFIAVLYSWVNKNASLPFWQFFSLCTSSFVIFQFQVPGYPDILVFLFFLLVMSENTDQASKLSLLLLSLLTHEASFLIGIILAWRYLGRNEKLVYGFALLFYGMIWLLVSNLNIYDIFASHTVSGMSGLEWVVSNLPLELLGIFSSYKMIWVIFVWAIIVGIQTEMWGDVKFILANIGTGILMTILAVDTSRIMGFAFPGLLISLSVLKNKISTGFSKRVLATIYLSNLFLPSIYVSLNVGPVMLSGLYKSYYSFISDLAKRVAYFLCKSWPKTSG